MPVTKASINWCFTINNPTDADHPTKWGEDVKYACWQAENNGTPHLQGYVEWMKTKRLSACKKVNQRAHWETRLGTQEQAIAYCKKEDTRTAGPWEIGLKAPGQGARSDLEAVGHEIISGKTIKEVAIENPGLFMQYGRGMRDLAMTTAGKYNHDDVRGVWYWGKPGTGKSRKARDDHPDAYLKAQNKWFDGYAGEDAIILDDMDKLGGDKLGHYLKIWADRYACTAEVKGSTVHLQHKVFLITSNYTPDDMWPDDEEMLLAIKRRFKIVEFKELAQSDQAQPIKKRKRSAHSSPTPGFKRMAVETPWTVVKAIKPKCDIGMCADIGPCFCKQNAYVDAKAASMEE
jgi:hypothetical protein